MSDLPNILLDAHLDIAFQALSYQRDFRLSVGEKRRRENKFPGHPYDEIGVATVGLPDLLLARVGIVFGTIWVCPVNEPFAHPAVTYETPHEAYQKALRQMDYYHRLADTDPRVRLIRFQKDLDAVLDTWAEGRDFEEHQLGIVLLMEGAEPILAPEQAQEWYERGVRIIGPAWKSTRYSAGTGEPGRLTKLGHQLLEVMGDLNMMLDCSHLAELAFFEAADTYPSAIIASHSNPRRFFDSDRNLSDDMIRQLVERDGVIGNVLYNAFLKNGWRPEKDRKSDVPYTLMLDVIDHICQVAGSARHVGIGTDWDGGFGWESIPDPFDTHFDLWQMQKHLLRNYSPDDVQQMFCGNFLRILRQSLPT